MMIKASGNVFLLLSFYMNFHLVISQDSTKVLMDETLPSEIRSGDKVILQCTATSTTPNSKILWSRNQNYYDSPGKEFSIQQTFDDKTLSLTSKFTLRVNATSGGHFQCEDKAGGVSATASTVVNVLVHVDSRCSAMSKTSAAIYCLVSELPIQLEFKWYFKGESDNQWKFIGSGIKHKINDMTKADFGMYKCVTSTPYMKGENIFPLRSPTITKDQCGHQKAPPPPPSVILNDPAKANDNNTADNISQQDESEQSFLQSVTLKSLILALGTIIIVILVTFIGIAGITYFRRNLKTELENKDKP